jgi:uncharacterized protein
MSGNLRIAVVGGGVSGLAAAHLLSRAGHDLTLFEASERLGGHACPVPLENGEFIDTAFLIFNSHSYPNFHRFLGELGVANAVLDTDMSIGLENRAAGLCFSVNNGLGGLYPGLLELLRPRFWKLLAEIRRFRTFADPETLAQAAGDLSLEDFLACHGFSDFFAQCFALPLGASVWSLPHEEIRKMPAGLFFQFFNNHKMLKNTQGARWQTLRGSSRVYLEAFERSFRGKIVRNTPVHSIARGPNGCFLRTAQGELEFDRVVIATHADLALKLLAKPSVLETELLSPWEYSPCEAFLHQDEEAFPRIRGTWPSWNVSYNPAQSAPFTVTYHLNRIQKVASSKPYFVSWGGSREPRTVLRRLSFRHPIFTPATERARARLAELQQGPVYFCGSYFGNGFHEDAVKSAFDLAAHFPGGKPC